MKINRWSLDRLLLWCGTAAIVALFIPMGVYITHTVSTSAEQSIAASGRSLARTVSGQIVEALLLEDRLAVHDTLHKAMASGQDVLYLCVVNADGRIVEHTFDRGYPLALLDLWGNHQGERVRFETAEGPILDISAPLLDGQLGTLHAGMSCRGVTEATDLLLWWQGIAMAVSLVLVVAGVRIAGAAVTQPLHRLEARVSRFPQQDDPRDNQPVHGTREVVSLTKRFSDMIERLVLLEREREASQERMVHAERLAALGELAAGLAHEVHNPLDGMLECVRYLEADPEKSSRGVKYYPMLAEGLHRIARTMRDMLTFTRLGEDLSSGACDVSNVLEALELLVDANLGERHVRLTWDKNTTCTCLCNRQGLSQAGLNLILNAADAVEGSDDPQVQIDVSCDRESVYIAIDDSGPGVPENLREDIFAPFFTTKPPDKGTGLGLSVSRQLIRAAGGELELSADPGPLGGARFVIRLPRAPASECKNA
ncbi:MAG: HAMP domain-containing histidine kinase [bacterium]|nr:HAMP domain-containing histidine kinase [bacterium]